MVDAERVLWCVKNGELSDLKIQLAKTDLCIDDTSLAKNRPAIVCAADYGQTKVVEFLLEKGANVNVTDQYGITPLLAAIWEGHVETVKLLLEKNADKKLKSPSGKTYYEEAENEKIKELLK